jgi:capsular exopolysaccharide synthesis family protein
MDSNKEHSQEETIDIREIIRRFAGYWPWFLASVAICLLIAFFKNYSSVPIYEVNASVLVQQEKSMLDDRFTSLNSLNPDDNSFQISNQIGILKSFSLAKRAIQRLNFRVSYFEKSRFNYRELYKVSPFIILIDSATSFPINVPVYVEITSPKDFKISVESNGGVLYHFNSGIITSSFSNLHFEEKGSLFQPFRSKYFNFKLVPNIQLDLKNFIGGKFYFIVNDDNTLARRFRDITIKDEKSSSILNISILGTNILKSVDYLNSLMEVYLEKGLEKKNQVAENTIRFINSQLGDVGDSLYFSEKTLQDYRSSHNLVDVNLQVQQVFTSLESLRNQRADIIVKIKYYDYLKQHLKESTDARDLIAPSSLGIQDIVLNNLITELINLYGERAELVLNSKRENPYLSSNESRIKDLRKSLFLNIENLTYASKISLQDIDKRIDEASATGNKLPEAQRNLIGYERKFKLNDALYTYLLTKRSETQIAKASYLPDNEVLDAASPDEYVQVYPNTRRNYLIALLLGLGLPMLVLFLMDYFNNKIQNDEDIESLTDYPILGHIIRSKEPEKSVVANYPMSLTAESVRAIRTNFQFIASEKNKNTILLTSSVKGEGKSFTSLNIALSLGLNNKKVILVNFDLRRPKLHDYLNITSEKGLSAYLSGNAALEEIIVPTGFENVDVILAGVIPPNPMELIANEQTQIMFKELKQRYDYILIDSPPLGVVADAFLLIKYSDVNIFIARQNYTLKKAFGRLMQNLKKREISNVNIILNDIRVDRRMGYNSYGYVYNYGYGYIDENTSKRKPKKRIKPEVQ